MSIITMVPLSTVISISTSVVRTTIAAMPMQHQAWDCSMGWLEPAIFWLSFLPLLYQSMVPSST